MRCLIIHTIMLAFLPGCVAWQSSIDDIRFDIASFRAQQSAALVEFQEESLASIATARADIEAAALEVAEQQASGAITQAEASILITEATNVTLDRAKLEVLAAEERRRESERIRAAETAAEIERVAAANEQMTRDLIAGVGEVAMSRFLGSNTGAALLGQAIRDSGSLTAADLERQVPEAVNQILASQGKEGMDPETAAMLGGGASLIPMLLLALRKLTEKQRYAKRIAENA